MKSKKVLSALISFIMLISACCSPFVSFASFFVVDGDVLSCPGNTRAYTETDKYNYAWLDSVIVREGNASVTQLTLYPVSNYPYSHTYSEFIDECNSYMKLFGIEDTAVQNSVMEILEKMYYTLVFSGKINDPIPDMRAYNESYGIVYPLCDEKFTDIYTVIVYACLKEDIGKLISDDGVVITRGTSVEGAVVKLLATVCNMNISSDIDTVSEFSCLFTRDYVVEQSTYPVSDEASEEEVLYWAKLQAADKAGYSVPSQVPYDELSVDEIEYVTYAYYASILTTRYGVMIDPYRLQFFLNSDNACEDVPRLVLISMLDYVSAVYSEGETTKALFNKTLTEGFFELENEFYTDIYNYKLYVPSDCEKIWITAFPIADQLDGGSSEKIKTFVDGNEVKNKSTNPIDIKSDTVTFSVDIMYIGKIDRAEYKFTVIRTDESSQYNKTPQIDLSDPVNEIVGNISSAVTGAADNVDNGLFDLQDYTSDSTLTTYSFDGSSQSYTGSLFNTYPTDEVGEVLTTMDPLSVDNTQETASSVLSDITEAVKENPAVIAAPAGLIAVGASAGFIFFRRRKDEGNFEDDDMEEEEILEEEEDFSEEEG